MHGPLNVRDIIYHLNDLISLLPRGVHKA